MVGIIRQNADGLHNFREFSQPKLPTSVLMRLKSIIAFLRYFWGIKVIHTHRLIFTIVLPSSKYAYLPMRAHYYLKCSLRRIIKSLRSVENEEVTSFYYIDSSYLLSFPNSCATIK